MSRRGISRGNLTTSTTSKHINGDDVVDSDPNWEQLPLDELQQLDALCNRFEKTLARDPETRIESFVCKVAEPPRLLIRELVHLEIEQRHARGAAPSPNEYAERFPQWADELSSLAVEKIAGLECPGVAAASADTIDQHGATDNHATTSKIESRSTQWRASASELSWSALPDDGWLGHYQLQSVIGRGGMGLVVQAHDTKLARDVAIKILAPEISHDPSANERFLREARAAASIRHDHVVTIHAVEVINQIPFLVMELIAGPTLEEYVRGSGKLPGEEVAALAYQMAQGLSAAHRRGLIHRDMKPANVLLERSDRNGGNSQHSTWNVKITDFGLARAAAEVRLTDAGLIAGTPQYMSPEQANGLELDPRSDLFSLGSVMYMMCAGGAAFEAESAVGILRQVADMPARSLREVSPEIPGWLIEIIDKLMAKSPDQRFQSATGLAEALGRQLHSAYAGPSLTPPLPRFVDERAGARRRLPRTASLLALTLLGIVAVALGIAVFPGDKRFPRDNSVQGLVDDQTPQVNQAETTNTNVGQSWHGWPADAPPPAIAPFNAAQARQHQLDWARHLGIKVEYTNSIGMKFQLIPPGEFTMGGTATEIDDALRFVTNAEHWQVYIRSEAPRHKVILTQPSYLGASEVTQAEYEKVMGQNPSHFSAMGAGRDAVIGMETPGHPVEMVSWNDAAEFCAQLSRLEQFKPFYVRVGETVTPMDGTGYRLPTEAEWEYACRAGTTSKYWNSDQDEDLEHAGWFRASSGRRTHAVGGLEANPFGLYDVHGNLWEWVQDGWDASSYGLLPEGPAVDPNIDFSANPQRAVRGGCCNDFAVLCRSSIRAPDVTATPYSHIGFRVSLPVDSVLRKVLPNAE